MSQVQAESVVYPDLSDEMVISIETLSKKEAQNATAYLLNLILSGYSKQFEETGLLPYGTLAGRYLNLETAKIYKDKLIPGVYDLGGNCSVIYDTDNGNLAGYLRVAPGDAYGERFAGMVAINEIVTRPEHQGKGFGSALLHAHLKFNEQNGDKPVMLHAYEGSPVNDWYRDLGFEPEQPTEDFCIGEYSLPMRYYVTASDITASSVVGLLEQKRPELATAFVD